MHPLSCQPECEFREGKEKACLLWGPLVPIRTHKEGQPESYVKWGLRAQTCTSSA